MDTSNLTFKKYEAKGGRFSPIVSINKNGNIYFSSGVTKKYGITESSCVGISLYYDEQNKVIAIKILKEKEDGMLSIKTGQGGGATINSKAFAVRFNFMKENKVSVKEEYAGQYYPIEEDIKGIGKVLLINLKEKRKQG